MHKLTKILFRSMIVMALFAAISYSPTPAGACPPFDRLITYYNNCTSGKTEVGWHYRSCGCGSSQSGTQDGLFKTIDDTNCETSEETITYWGRCNYGDPWEQLSDIDACPNHC
jgi:hypothetical protein